MALASAASVSALSAADVRREGAGGRGRAPPRHRHARRMPAAVPSAASSSATPPATEAPPVLPDGTVAGFHVARMRGSERQDAVPPVNDLDVLVAESDAELNASAWLRSMTFYVYPPDRKFAGEIHQLMVQEEEYKLLKSARMARRLDALQAEQQQQQDGPRERSACLVAMSSDPEVLAASDPRLVVDGRALVGTLDLHAVRALDGQILIGDCKNAAYLGNVCTSPAARRRGVGHQLIAAVRKLAREWGVEQLYVHSLAVNEIGRRFYEGVGFVVEKEESSNTAHYRGHCLDGVEGAGRTLLWRDTQLWADEEAR